MKVHGVFLCLVGVGFVHVPQEAIFDEKRPSGFLVKKKKEKTRCLSEKPPLRPFLLMCSFSLVACWPLVIVEFWNSTDRLA